MYAKKHKKRSNSLLNGLISCHFALFVTRLTSRIRAHYEVVLSSQRTQITALAATRHAPAFPFNPRTEGAGAFMPLNRSLIFKGFSPGPFLGPPLLFA